MRLATSTPIFVAMMLAGSANADVWYRYQQMGPPWCEECYERADAAAINNHGQVCGRLDLRYPDTLANLWQPATDTLDELGSLPTCDQVGAIATDMNDAGHVVGRDSGAGCFPEAWLSTPDSGILGLGHLPGDNSSEASAINAYGEIAGFSRADDGLADAFVWNPLVGMIAIERWPEEIGSYTTDINDQRWVVGRTQFLFDSACFLWTPEAGKRRLSDLMGGDFDPVDAVAINNHGQIIGRMSSETLGYFAYLWDAQSGMREISRPGPPETTFSEPVALNNHGAVVGVAYVAGENDFPFVWDTTRGFRRLDTRIDPCTRPYLRRLRVATGINDQGQIIANPWGDGVYAVQLTPYIAGDLNEDSSVALDDLGGLLANFGRAEDAGYEQGDLDCDADVDLQDLAILLSNFGDSVP